MTSSGGGVREERFTAVFRAHYADVYRYALRRVGEADAHDLTSEVFATAWRHIDRLPDPALPWLYRAAWHAVGNRRRTITRRGRLLGRLGSEAVIAAPGRDPA